MAGATAGCAEAAPVPATTSPDTMSEHSVVRVCRQQDVLAEGVGRRCGHLLEMIGGYSFRAHFMRRHCPKANALHGLELAIDDYAAWRPILEADPFEPAETREHYDARACQALYVRSIDTWLARRYPAADWPQLVAACNTRPRSCDRTTDFEERLRLSHERNLSAWLAAGRPTPRTPAEHACRTYPNVTRPERTALVCSAYGEPSAD